VLEFEDAVLEPDKVVISEEIPEIRWKQFVFKNLNYISIYLGAAKDTDKKLLSMSGKGIYMRSHLETLSSEGLQFEQSIMSFDMQGKMDATFVTVREQCLHCWYRAAQGCGSSGCPAVQERRCQTGRTSDR
jgi:hypothetical protein